MDLTPTPAFIVSLLPLPFLAYMNVKVGILLLKVRKASRGRELKYPHLYREGKILGFVSALFAITPALVEWRIFVRNPLWSISYLVGGLLGILALKMVHSALTQELSQLERRKRPSSHKK